MERNDVFYIFGNKKLFFVYVVLELCCINRCSLDIFGLYIFGVGFCQFCFVVLNYKQEESRIRCIFQLKEVGGGNNSLECQVVVFYDFFVNGKMFDFLMGLVRFFLQEIVEQEEKQVCFFGFKSYKLGSGI